MILLYGVIFDCYYYKWDVFFMMNVEGFNFRFEIQLEVMKEVVIVMKKVGCKYMLVVGDIFYV